MATVSSSAIFDHMYGMAAVEKAAQQFLRDQGVLKIMRCTGSSSGLASFQTSGLKVPTFRHPPSNCTLTKLFCFWYCIPHKLSIGRSNSHTNGHRLERGFCVSLLHWQEQSC